MRKFLYWFALLLCLGVFAVAGWQLLKTLLAYKEARDTYSAVAEAYAAEVETGKTGQKTVVKKDGEQVTLQRIRPADGRPEIYVDEEGREAAPIDVDFDALLAECEDVIGWIYCEDTIISYPIVQAEDNDYYLRRLLDGSYSNNGSIFMDFTCDPFFRSDNTLIYGHNIKDGSMFQKLTKYRDQEYYDEHPTFYILTPTQNYSLFLFSGMTVNADGWVYKTGFSSEADKQEYIDRAVVNSDFDSPVIPSVEDTLVTLSTCSTVYENARYVVIGVLRPLGEEAPNGAN